MIRNEKLIKIFTASLLSISFILGVPGKANADPLIIGISTCFYVGGPIVYADASTWVGAVDYPEAQIIGQISTITMPGAPYIQVMPLGTDIVSPIDGGFVYQIWERLAISGAYTVTTLHGYIDEDGTEHESGTSFWGCSV